MRFIVWLFPLYVLLMAAGCWLILAVAAGLPAVGSY